MVIRLETCNKTRKLVSLPTFCFCSRSGEKEITDEINEELRDAEIRQLFNCDGM